MSYVGRVGGGVAFGVARESTTTTSSFEKRFTLGGNQRWRQKH